MTAPGGGSTAVAALLDGPVLFPRHGTERISAAAPHDLAAHRRHFGDRAVVGPAELHDAVAATGLTGRGGGHFPVATKWQAALAAGARRLVVNGAEGEPASAKDAALLQQRPHLVLDGVAAAAGVLGATESVVWLHDDAVATRRAVERAVLERSWLGLPDPPVRVVTGPRRYVSGQVTAVLRALDGGPALPRTVVDPAAPWVDGPPALVHNVETWARVGLLTHVGPADRPTSLVTVVTSSHRVVRDVDPVTTIGELVASDDPLQDPSAVLLGGYGGQWVTWAEARDLPLDPHVLRGHGRSLGAGVVAPLDRASCGLVETARVLDYLAASSARQCGSCWFGLDAIAGLAARLARGRLGRGDRRRLDRYAAEVVGRGACAHPDGAVRLLMSALEVFDEEVRSHTAGRACVHRPRALPLLPIPGETTCVT